MPIRSGDVALRLAAVMLLGAASVPSWAQDAATDVRQLVEQNRRLEEQVRNQQKTIDELSAKMAAMMRASEQQAQDLRGLQERVDATSSAAAVEAPDREHEVRVAGEAGLAFFNTGADGQFPNAEFRVDDALISIEAPVWHDVYFFSELKLLTREANTDSPQLGELYVDFEDVSNAWNQPGQLSFRAGRINTPFGEEYQHRGPVENPLISHSLSDIWGTDEGFEIYGKVAGLRYVAAVQNGGTSRLHDFNPDKAVVARVIWDPTSWLHLSGSAMRTGSLSVAGDGLSDLWFTNGFFRALGSPSTTTEFWADLWEGDAVARWQTGHLGAAFGGVRFADNDRTANNRRQMRYGYLELVQDIADRLYGAARFSEVRARRGFPLTGWGAPGDYFFRPSLTEYLRRLSLGLGYRFGPPLVWKLEYSWESGRMLNGAPRNHEDFVGSEIGLKF